MSITDLMMLTTRELMQLSRKVSWCLFLRLWWVWAAAIVLVVVGIYYYD